MANGMYTAGITGIMNGSIDLDSNTINAVLVNTANYTVNLSSHTVLADVPASARKGTRTLTGKTVSGGVFDASDLSINGVNADDVNAIIIYKESSTALIAYIDTGFSATGALANNTVTITWNAGTNKIFKIG